MIQDSGNNRSQTDNFIDDLYEISQNKFSDNVIIQAKRCLLDYLGVTFAGSKMLRDKSNDLIDSFGCVSGTVSVLGLNRKIGLSEAVLINGLHSHVAELDDGERYGMFHPGAPIFSALIPVAQKFKISGHQFLTAIIVGYEASIRLARALQPGLRNKGFHATGICGTIGAAIAVGIALNFSKKQLKDTLSAAATSSSGLSKMVKDSSEMKPFNVGNAAQNGLNAALLVKAGFEGPDDVLDGIKGFLTAFTGKYDVSQLVRHDMHNPAIMGIYVKPYAACRHCHPAIEAAIRIRNKYGITINAIKSVNVRTHHLGVEYHEHTEIKGVNSAKMSTPYSVAVALKTGNGDINSFSETWINNKQIASLTRRIKLFEDDELTALAPKQRAAIVELFTTDNKCYSERIDLPKGEPETPLTNEEIQEKFISLLIFSETKNIDLEDIIKYIWHIETDIEHLMQSLTNSF